MNYTSEMDNKKMTTMPNFGKCNPYTVPEGYFESLTQRVMDNVSAAEKDNIVSIRPKKNAHWKVWASGIAACIAGTLVCINLIDSKPNPAENTALSEQNQTETYTYDEQYQTAEMNYAMVDYNDVYNYLSGSGY